jgi:hypothetical protein
VEIRPEWQARGRFSVDFRLAHRLLAARPSEAHMNRTQIIASMVLFSAAACGGVVNGGQHESASGAGGSGGSSTGTTTDVSSGVTVGSGGSATSSSASTGPGGAPACIETSEAFTMSLTLPGGTTYGCQGGTTGEVVLEGAVVDGDSGGWTIDTCSPAADCIPSYAKITASAPELFVYLPIGTYVRVRVDVEQPWGCTQMIQIDNMSSWDGFPNPAWSGDFMWLAGADGTSETFAEAPFSISPIAQGCYPNEPPGCGPHEDYQLQFSDAVSPAMSVVVPMGQTTFLNGAKEYWTIRNLRSFESGNCDDYWNWGYWVMPQLLEGDG